MISEKKKNIHIGIPLSKGAKITALDWHALVKSLKKKKLKNAM